mmetsp:Transcript_22801/g.45708  ORF Transcript_22801/g.45708 Transcript_22801/m.45708 type:complete len:426 (-) Transcript_22801:336-1613(-)
MVPQLLRRRVPHPGPHVLRQHPVRRAPHPRRFGPHVQPEPAPGVPRRHRQDVLRQRLPGRRVDVRGGRRDGAEHALPRRGVSRGQDVFHRDALQLLRHDQPAGQPAGGRERDGGGRGGAAGPGQRRGPLLLRAGRAGGRERVFQRHVVPQRDGPGVPQRGELLRVDRELRDQRHRQEGVRGGRGERGGLLLRGGRGRAGRGLRQGQRQRPQRGRRPHRQTHQPAPRPRGPAQHELLRLRLPRRLLQLLPRAILPQRRFRLRHGGHEVLGVHHLQRRRPDRRSHRRAHHPPQRRPHPGARQHHAHADAHHVQAEQGADAQPHRDAHHEADGGAVQEAVARAASVWGFQVAVLVRQRLVRRRGEVLVEVSFRERRRVSRGLEVHERRGLLQVRVGLGGLRRECRRSYECPRFECHLDRGCHCECDCD